MFSSLCIAARRCCVLLQPLQRQRLPFAPHKPKRLTLPVLATIPQVIGTAIALLLLSGGGLPLWGGVLLAAVAAFLLLFMERLGVRYLEIVFEVLIAGETS